MTSSLVGSEMCIRDRLRSLHQNAWLQHAASTHRRVVTRRGVKQGDVASTCLLYTSDAADDM
eukprot:4024863-Prorocentrum_lima.AAC.1